MISSRLHHHNNGTFTIQTDDKIMSATDATTTAAENPATLQANGGPEIEAVKKTINKRMRRKQSKWTLIVTFLSLVLIIILITVAYLVSKGLFHDIANKVKSLRDPLQISTHIVV